MDTELIQEIVSSSSLALSTITLLVSRVDRHKDDSIGKDSVLALTKLESLLDGWVQQSRITNIAVKKYVEGRGDPFEFHYVIGLQYRITVSRLADDALFIDQWRTGWRRKKLNLAQFLRIYVPEFAEAFEKAARNRYDLLREAESNIQPTHELVNALDVSSKDLEKALLQLQAFMRKNIQP